MYFEQFYLTCLAHASYMIGSEGEAAVIDPQRDVDLYLEAAAIFSRLTSTPTLSLDTRNWPPARAQRSTSELRLMPVSRMRRSGMALK